MIARKSKPIVSILVLLTLIISQFASCGETPVDDSNASKTGITTTSDETTRLRSDLPDTDFGGEEFKILQRYMGEGHIHNFFEYDTEQMNGELLNDAIYNRNRIIEERFNVNIIADGSSSPAQEVYPLVMAGDCDYNVIADRPVELAKHAAKGTFYSIDKLPYLNIEMPWWNANANEAFKVEGHLCFITGDYVLYEKQRLPIMLFNGNMADELRISNLYNTVTEGSWTVDLMNEYAALARNDLNGDGKMNFNDDQFGMLNGSYTYIPFMLFSMGNSFSQKADDGSFELTLTTSHMIDSIEKLGKTIFTDTTVWGEVITNNWTEGDSPQSVFESGRALFYYEVVQIIRLLDCDIRYGVLPMPKYDENQKRYLTTVQYDNSGAIAVPVTLSADEVEMTGLVLEALAEESHYTTLPAFIEGILQIKKAPDKESSEILSIVFTNENIVYDMFAAYNVGNLNNFVADNLYKNHGKNYVSAMESKRNSIMGEYQKIVESFQSIE